MSKLEKKQILKILEIKYTPTPDDARLRRVFELLLSHPVNTELSDPLKSEHEDSHHSAVDTGDKTDG